MFYSLDFGIILALAILASTQWCMEEQKHGRKSPQKHAGSSGSFGSLAMSLVPYVTGGCR